MAEEKACKKCGFIISGGDTCPICGSKDLTTKWSSYVIILNVEKSALAAKMNIALNGRFAINI
ncbi:MAG: transcription elongation factor subunit Spt4 [Candidatus Micrarchaeaceae archaeon]